MPRLILRRQLQDPAPPPRAANAFGKYSFEQVPIGHCFLHTSGDDTSRYEKVNDRQAVLAGVDRLYNEYTRFNRAEIVKASPNEVSALFGSISQGRWFFVEVDGYPGRDRWKKVGPTIAQRGAAFKGFGLGDNVWAA